MRLVENNGFKPHNVPPQNFNCLLIHGILWKEKLWEVKNKLNYESVADKHTNYLHNCCGWKSSLKVDYWCYWYKTVETHFRRVSTKHDHQTWNTYTTSCISAPCSSNCYGMSTWSDFGRIRRRFVWMLCFDLKKNFPGNNNNNNNDDCG